MKVPKILHFIPSVNPSFGGTIQGIKALHVFTDDLLDDAVVSLDSLEDPWVKEFSLPIYAIGPGKGLYGFSWGALDRLEMLVGNVDAVVVNGIWQYSSILAHRYAQRNKIPLLTFPHGMLDPWFNKQYPLKHLKKCLYWPFGDYRVLRDSAKVLFTTQLECELARNSFPWLYRANEYVLGYGCPPPPQMTTSQTEAFYNACPGARNKRVILFLSRIHEKKGCDIGLRAFRDTFAKDDSMILVMAGPCHDDYLDRMKRLAEELYIQDKVIWPGMLSGDAKWGAFYNSSAFILPSHQENFGIALAEALACGLPTLTTYGVNIFKEILAYKAGLVSTDDVQGTTEIYKKFMAMTNEERSQMQENSLHCFSDCFNAESAASRFVKLIKEEINWPLDE